MEFPTIKELRFSDSSIENFSSFLELNYHFNGPYFINVEPFDKNTIEQMIVKIKSYCHCHSHFEYGPYPLYLVGTIIDKEHFDWRYFVREEKEISRYFKRKIFLKDIKQMKKVKTFQLYRIGINEQNVSEVSAKMKDVNEIYFSLKNEKIQRNKLNKIIDSFSKRNQ